MKNLLSAFFIFFVISIICTGQINYPFSDTKNNRDIQAYWYNIPQDSVIFENGDKLIFQSALHIYGKTPEDDFQVQVKVFLKNGKKVFEKIFEIKKTVKPYFMEFNNGYFKLRHAVEYLKENPDKIIVTIKSSKEERRKEIKCRYYKLSGKITDFKGKPVKAFIGVCPDSFLSEQLGKWSDSQGNYEIFLPERTYNALIVETAGKGMTDLEAWAWHTIVDSDQVMNFKIGNGEVYNLNVWVNNGGGNSYFISFRPMVLGRVFPPKNYVLSINGKKFNVSELVPPLNSEDLKIKINGKKAEIISIQKYFETGFLTRTIGLLSYLIQVSRKGFDTLGKQTVVVEYEKEIEINGKKVKVNSMGCFQFYLNYEGLSKYF